MADQNINYKITVDVESGTASLRDLQGRIRETQVPVTKLTDEFNILTAELRKNANQINASVIAHKNSELSISAEINSLNTLRSALDVSSKEYEQLGNRISLLNQKLKTVKSGSSTAVFGLEQLKNSSGAATSATLELGRAISDAPYGVRGVANNLSQFASQFSFMANTVDNATGKVVGFSGAMKNLGRAIKANAILLVIQTIISAFDYFAGGQEKAKKTTEDLTKELKEQVDVLNDYKDALDNSNLSLDERNGLVGALTIKSKEFAKIIKESKGGLDSETEALNKFLKKKEGELDVKERIAKLDVINKIIRDEEIKGLDNVNKEIETYTKLQSLTNDEGRQSSSLLETRIQQLNDVANAYKNQKIILKELNDIFEENPENDDKFKKGTVDWYKKQISDKEKLRDSTADNTAEYKNQTAEIEILREALKKLIGEQGKREKVTGLGLEIIDIGETRKKMQQALDIVADGFNVDMKKNPLSIKPVLDLELTDEAKARIAAYNKSVNDELTLNRKLDNFSEYAELTRQALTSISDFTNAQYDRDLVIERNKTTALNEELNQRLLNENLSKEERARIQNEIAQNDEALRKKQNEIKKKQFNTQKAFNIASALVDTGRAAAGVMADAKGGFFTRLSQAIPTIAFGLAQVATIASQKFQPDAASTPIRTSGGGGSGGGGMADRSFNFNLVGNNKENQLANAIQGQFSQPLKAYVVSRDMSSQQQLDANIVDSARF